MVTTVSEVISNAWYKSGFQPADSAPGGAEINIGFRELKRAMAAQEVTNETRPFLTNATVQTIAGQESYLVPGLLSIESLSFNDGDIRYYLERVTEDEYFSFSRVDNIKSLPYKYYAKRTPPALVDGAHVESGTEIYLYFEPNKVYTLNIVGKYSDATITLNTDLELTYPLWMIDYFELLLAKRLCQYYAMQCPPTILDDLADLKQKIKELSISPELKRSISYLSSNSSNDPVRRMWEGTVWGG